MSHAAVHAGLAVALLAEGRPCWGAASSASMAPFLLPTDRLLVEPLRRPARAGELVAVLRAGEVVVHRVVRRQPGGCWTKGDAALALDPFVDDDAVLGVVTAVEPSAGGRVDLTRARWRLAQRLLGPAGWWAARSADLAGPAWLRALVWRACRGACHLTAACARGRRR